MSKKATKIQEYNIAYITDKSYLFATLVSIKSAIRCSENKQINIWVICVDLLENDKKVIESQSNENVNIRLIETDNELANLNIKHPYISKAVFLKLKLPEIFKNLDTVLYLDGDVLLFPGYLSIFDEDINEYYAGAVEDMCAVCFNDRENYIGNDHYFNAGVLYLNLRLLREDNCYEKLIIEQKRDEVALYMEQDTFNRIIGGKTLFLKPYYNFLSINNSCFSPKEIADFYGLDDKELEKTINDPYILHYAGGEKPWNNLSSPELEKWLMFVEDEDFLFCLKQYILYVSTKEKEINQKNAALEAEIKEMNQKIDDLRTYIDRVHRRTLYGLITRSSILRKIIRIIKKS